MSEQVLNPSNLVISGAVVTSANPLPCTTSGGSGGADPVTVTYLNPRTWLVSGAVITSANPLPIVLV